MLKSIKGSLLFECFVALLIFSIGIVGALRLFAQALYVGQRSTGAAQSQAGLDQSFFEWQAVPGAKTPGPSVSRIRAGDESREYEYETSFTPFKKEKTGPHFKGEYGIMKIRVTDPSGRKINEFESVVLGAKA